MTVYVFRRRTPARGYLETKNTLTPVILILGIGGARTNKAGCPLRDETPPRIMISLAEHSPISSYDDITNRVLP